MTYDAGRVRHDGMLMHYSRSSNGTAVPSNWKLSAIGDTGVTWTPETAGGVSYGSNSNEVSYANAPGASSLVSRADHVHRGVTSLSHASNTYTGPVTLETEGSLYIVRPSANTYRFGSTGGGGGGGSSGALILLEQYTASSSATLDFTTFVSSTYDVYMFEFVNVLPATDAVDFLIRMGTGGGPTYDSGSNYDWSHLFTYPATNSGVEGAGATTSIKVRASVTNTTLGVVGTARLYNPQSTSLQKAVTYDTTSYVGAVSAIVHDNGQGIYKSTTAVTAIRFLMSSGNIASGTIRAYGIAKS